MSMKRWSKGWRERHLIIQRAIRKKLTAEARLVTEIGEPRRHVDEHWQRAQFLFSWRPSFCGAPRGTRRKITGVAMWRRNFGEMMIVVPT